MLLRRWQPQDEPEMARINRDPEVARHLNRPLDEYGIGTFFDAMVSHWEHYGYGPWALESLEPDTKGCFLGFTGLASVPPFLAGAGAGPELGWRLDRASWGRGLATEAALAVRDEAFGRLELPELISIIHPDNQRSQRVAIKLGMQRTRSIENGLLGREVDVWQLTARSEHRTLTVRTRHDAGASVSPGVQCHL
jgi:RimJ/RimL family protein N-acetyltransferase